MTTIIFLIVVLGIFILIKMKVPVWRGRRGESYVSAELLDLAPSRYKVLNDVMLPSTGNTVTTQIDHIVISNHGIFCIETKSLTGWIFGNANQDYWTQVIYRYKGRFYNPLRQNYAHIKAIEALLGPRRLKRQIVSLVVFTKADKLKISGTNSVCYESEVVNKIGSYIEPIYSDVERDGIYNLLATANILDERTRTLHVRAVRDLKRY